jgi:hypothetical protein
MSLDIDTAIQAHVHAMVDLLLGKKRMEHGLIFCAGGEQDNDGRLAFARAAAASRADVVHFEFNYTAGCYLTGINLVIPRDDFCLVATDCQLYLAKGARRAVIVPKLEVRGHFSALPGELLHRDGKPKDLDAGVERASRRLEQLMRTQQPVRGDIEVGVVSRRPE